MIRRDNNSPLLRAASFSSIPYALSMLLSATLEIRNVWAENLDEEMAVIRELVEKYAYVAMDT